MLTTKIIWGFTSFLFFKIALAASLGATVTISCAVILGCVVTFLLFQSVNFYLQAADQHFLLLQQRKPTSFFIQALKTYSASCLIIIFIGKMIIFGFSSELNYRLGNELFFNLDNSYLEGSFICALILSVPSTIHFLIIARDVNTREILLGKQSAPVHAAKEIDPLKGLRKICKILQLENNKIKNLSSLIKSRTQENKKIMANSSELIELAAEKIDICTFNIDCTINDFFCDQDLKVAREKISNLLENNVKDLELIANQAQKERDDSSFVLVDCVHKFTLSQQIMLDAFKVN